MKRGTLLNNQKTAAANPRDRLLKRRLMVEFSTTESTLSIDDTVQYAVLHHFASAFPTLSSSTLPNNPITFASLAFERLFSEREASWEFAHDLSREERVIDGGCSTSLGYGEILPETVFQILACIKDRHGGLREGPQVVWDLGSGSGRVLFAANLIHPFKEAHGIEYLGSLHKIAQENLRRWNASFSPSPCSFFFSCGDISKIDGYKLSPSPTLLICHATLFDNDLFAAVQLIAENCEVGSTFVMVTRELRTGTKTGIETLSLRQWPMSWGKSVTVYIQRRV